MEDQSQRGQFHRMTDFFLHSRFYFHFLGVNFKRLILFNKLGRRSLSSWTLLF